MLPEQYPAMFRALPIPCLILDKDFIIREVTDVYLELSHRTREGVHRRSYFDIFTNESFDLERMLSTRQVLFDSLCKVRDELVEVHMPISRFDLPDENGNPVEHYWTSWSVPLLDQNGELLYILHRVEDITKYISAVGSIKRMGDGLYDLADLLQRMLERTQD